MTEDTKFSLLTIGGVVPMFAAIPLGLAGHYVWWALLVLVQVLCLYGQYRMIKRSA